MDRLVIYFRDAKGAITAILDTDIPKEEDAERLLAKYGIFSKDVKIEKEEKGEAPIAAYPYKRNT